MKLPIDSLPLNVPVAMATVALMGGAAALEGIALNGLVRAGLKIGGYAFLASYIFGQTGILFSKLMKPDLSRLSVFKRPGIDKFDAPVPIE